MVPHKEIPTENVEKAEKGKIRLNFELLDRRKEDGKKKKKKTIHQTKQVNKE